METAKEKSASLSFLSSYPTCSSNNRPISPEICSDPEEPWLDAEIVVEGKSVAVNRSILSERSYLMSLNIGPSAFRFDKHGTDFPPHYYFPAQIIPFKYLNFEYIILNQNSICPCSILYVLYYLWLLEVVEKALVEDVIPILMAALHCQLNQLRSYWIQRIARSNLDNVCLEKELPDEVSSEIKSLRVKYNQESEANIAEVNPINAKVVRGIHRALDSGDVELLKLLLDVSNVTLDDAYTLHYAAAYCNPMVFKEVLNMGSAGLNLKDARGRTVLHVAARHKEPAVMVALLSKGAWASETTSDGQTALAISTKQGQETNKDRLCIDVLEREMRRNSMSGNLAMSAEVMDDDFQRKLDYMENIVACVRLFPSEARVAMEIAGADTTTGLSALGRKGLSGNLKEVDLNETPKEVDLNETPSMQAKRCQLRLLALLKT
ncbi:hypothetical protein CISIN_1g0469551mg, partial [Citrus sinensis]